MAVLHVPNWGGLKTIEATSELELGTYTVIQTQMAQEPVLRAEVLQAANRLLAVVDIF